MPRLIGKTSKTPLYVGISLLATVAVLGALEYSGTIDLIPGFGQSRRVTGTLDSLPGKPSTR